MVARPVEEERRVVFRSVADKTRWEGLMVSGWLLLIDLLLIIWVANRPSDTLRFLLVILIMLSVPPLFHLLYRTWGAFTLEYWVDRNAVTIRWANLRQVIPLPEIRQVIQGSEVTVSPSAWRYWPAPYVRSTAQGPSRMMLFATQPLPNCLLLDTDELIFAISPADEPGFIDALQQRYRLGPSQSLVIEQLQSSWLERLLGPGRIGPVLLTIGFVGVLALFGVLMVRFPELPNPLPVRFTSTGLPELVRDKDVLFRIPVIGLLAWTINGLWGIFMAWRHQPVGAYLLWSGTIVVQVFLFLALRSVLP
jgi:hypothetical protein